MRDYNRLNGYDGDDYDYNDGYYEDDEYGDDDYGDCDIADDVNRLMFEYFLTRDDCQHSCDLFCG